MAPGNCSVKVGADGGEGTGVDRLLVHLELYAGMTPLVHKDQVEESYLALLLIMTARQYRLL